VRAPNTYAISERFVKIIRDQCLSVADGVLRPGHVPQGHQAIAEFVEHYHAERNHQGIGNRLLLQPGPSLPVTEGTVCRQVRLGGLLSFYHRRKRRAAS
jgi:hypothetical protein